MKTLLPHLACPECRTTDGLSLERATTLEGRRWQSMLREAAELQSKLVCRACTRSYPVTDDGIPVLWSDALERTFRSLHKELNAAAPTEQDVKAANIQLYDTISNAYDAEGVHADSVTRSRMVSAFEEAAAGRRGPHVDVGCGAGNVLEFFTDVLDGPRIGVDVSLTGLRAVRRKGFDAVMGDAERLPFAEGSIGLITASSVLHHLFRPERLMCEAYSVLRKGGVFLTDFDPNGRAARWGWLALQLYALRRPVYSLLSRGRRRVFHSSKQVQTWNALAEFHNKPGEGFDIGELQSSLVNAGFELRRIFPHNCRDNSVHQRSLVRPSARHLLVQSLSGRNAFSRRNSDTLLTASVKPEVPARMNHQGEISPWARQVTQKLFAAGASALQESEHALMAAAVPLTTTVATVGD
ncbi:MAG: methyltransferase domain-containing protein [Planctomycetaceae bacterium]|nr:methyltransferase domain-containing protein [Planctomycetaceae bacterium]